LSAGRLRRLMCIVSALAIAASLLSASCGRAEKPRIGVVVATMQEAVYSFMKRAMTDRMLADGVEVIWVSSENNEAKQRFDLQALLAMKIQVLILQPVRTENSASLVTQAREAGIPVIALDRLPADARVDVYVTADSREVGRLQAELLSTRLGYRGRIAILRGDEGNSVAGLITQGNIDVLSKYPGMRIVIDRSHRSWDRDLARLTVEEALDAAGGLDGILANNSGMAMGAVEALRDRKLNGSIPVVGADADLDACLSILDGDMLGDVDKRPYALGTAAYEAALDLMHGKRPAADATQTNGPFSIPVLLTPVRLITQGNLRADMSYRWGALALTE
jgi:D-xylose transport system substrate-binding protein